MRSVTWEWIAPMVVGVLGMLFLTTNPMAQQPVSTTVTSTAEVVTVVPFTLMDGYILVHASVDGHQGTFLLDTGSPAIFLNPEYLRILLPDERARQEFARRQLDTVRLGEDQTPNTRVIVRTLQLGSLRLRLDPRDAGPPTPWPTNAMTAAPGWLALFERSPYPPVLGTLGLPVLEPFETIIDYARQQLILIRLDATGQRLGPVRAYVPAQRLSLLPLRTRRAGTAPALADTVSQWWGVAARLGGALDTLLVDTGTPYNVLLPTTADRLVGHMNADTVLVVDTLALAHRIFTAIPFAWGTDNDLLGYPVLRQLGLVGFNFRARQLLLYRAPVARP